MNLIKMMKRPLWGIVFVSFFVFGLYVSVTSAGANSLWNNGRPDRSLAFYNTHTHETLDVTYWESGRYNNGALDAVNWHLRDHRREEEASISRELLNFLHDIKAELRSRYPDQDIVFHVISGYRSPKTNAMLRAGGGGQAKKSRHMHGDAIDIRVPGVDSADIRDIAWCMQRGGVGYYRGSDFVHVDTHDIRFWNWRPTSSTCAEPNS